MSLVGNLKTVSFSDLLQLVSTNKKTGMLSVTRYGQQRNIFFVKGEIISFISSDQEDWFLSQLLFRRKKIGKKEWDRALLLSKSSGRRIVDTLIESGLLSKAEVLEALRIRTEETVFAIFGWEEAEFEFAEGKLPPPGVLALRTNTMALIMEGAKRVDEWAEVQKTLPPQDFSLTPNLHPPAEQSRINLTLDEYQTLLLVDGKRTVNEILLESPSGEFSTSKSLSGLISRGLISKGEKRIVKEKKDDEEKILIDILFEVYHRCFSLVDEALIQKLGRGKDAVVSRLTARQKENSPSLGKLIKRGTLEKTSFFSTAQEIPGEIRLHQLLDSLNFALSQSLKTLRSILGENVKNSVSDRIKKELSSILDRDKSVSEKYQLSEEIHRMLNKV
jgi:hypothetical protein